MYYSGTRETVFMIDSLKKDVFFYHKILNTFVESNCYSFTWDLLHLLKCTLCSWQAIRVISRRQLIVAYFLHQKAYQKCHRKYHITMFALSFITSCNCYIAWKKYSVGIAIKCPSQHNQYKILYYVKLSIYWFPRSYEYDVTSDYG